jgi:hypothetical protein
VVALVEYLKRPSDFQSLLLSELISRSIYLVSSQQGKCISPFAFLLQMAAASNVFWDYAGHLHTNALHWEGFPRLLWESLSLFFYTEPP